MTLLVAVVAIALAIPMAVVVANDQRAAFVSRLEVDTLSSASLLASQSREEWPAAVEEIAALTGARVIVVDQELQLVADSDNSSLDRTFDRPEVIEALDGALASDVRPSTTVGEDLRYVAAPVVQDLGVSAAVRLTLPESIVDEDVRETVRWLAVFVLAVIVAAGLVAWLLARSIASPLNRLAAVAHALPEDLDRRADEGSGPAEVRDVAAALNSTAQRLSGILQRTQRVAADASHHLRTPLTGVRLRLEAIEETTTQADVRQDAHAATVEVDRLTRRIDQVLALTRSDAGNAALERQDVAAIAAERAEAAAAALAERGVDVQTALTPGLVVLAPAGVISRAVDELLSNAGQYARSRIEVSSRRLGDEVVLAVADDGPGIPAEEREAVFQRFTRGSTSVPGGSGLGLALVRESVVGIGGSASATESRWGGLDIVLRLPVADGS